MKKNIELLRLTRLRGPNIWTYRPALEAWVDIGDLEDCPSNTLPGFPERLAALLPSLIEHRCSVGERGGFLQRVREGTWPAHIVEHVTLELQNLVGQRTGFGKARSTSRRGIYKIVVRSRQPEVSEACLLAARDLVMAAIEDRPYDLTATLGRLRDLADRYCLGPSTACIVDAATERRIPSIRLTEGNLVQLGYGARQRRIWTAETDRTSAIAEGIARDKDLSKRLLAGCGIPVPEGRLVESETEAWEAAGDIGTPVVVKPCDANHGRGVSTALSSRAEIEAAYRLAEKQGSGVIVERHIEGNEHRLLVVGNRMVAAAKGESAWVVGNGHSTIAELIDDQINSDPRRGITEDFPLNVILAEEDATVALELQRQGLDANAIPANGRRVLIQRNGNVAIDVTDDVHPDIADTVCLAARVIGLDIAGVDLVATDIARPLAEQRGAIVEINAGPGLLMHLKPAEGKPRPVGPAIVEHLFPADETGRIAVVGITGSRGKTEVARLLAYLLQLAGHQTGLACSNGSYVGRRCTDRRDGANWAGAHRMLTNRSVEAAVFETGAASILGEGLAYDRCQVAVVTNLDPAATLPEFDVGNAEQMIGALRTLVDVVLPEGVAVLNAADQAVAELAPLCDGDVVFFATDAACVPLAEHRRQGRRAVFTRDNQIVLATGADEFPLLDLASLPTTSSATLPFRIDNLLAATAAAWTLDVAPDLIRAGIIAFAAEPDTPSPGDDATASVQWRPAA